MALRNIIIGLVLAAFAIVYGTLALQLPERNIEGTPGPGFFPGLIGVILLVLSVALVAQGARAWRTGDQDGARQGLDRRGTLMLALFAAYILVLPFAGFIVASVPFAGAMMWLFGGRKPLLVVAGAIVLPLLLSLLFGEVFRIPLPHGSWPLPGG